ncbi:FecR family protein [Mucilaginibacter dorajii]|uniref:DUF4974 domain-containing protein n=1 Tax=Mucilaginibacter dorajii TaxID=692994 RepID=A0ABP7R0A6_9SPHI|nr:FecR family protein [Mucilaginibacter dorajii]MCS3732304.1 ferric-dicitrate binding protein FerR (iron transport regulator) [Mucilaginibacter dorajii]
MNQEELNNLIDKVNEGAASEDELYLYTTYLNQITSGEEAWKVEELGTEESVKIELENRIEGIRKPNEVKKIRLWPRVAVAAAVVAAIGFGVWFYTNEIASSQNTSHNDVLVNDIEPGKNTATLTLADGTAIPLSDTKTGVVVGAKLKYSDGTSINSPSAGKASYFGSGKNGKKTDKLAEGDGSPQGGRRSTMLIASTPKGGTYQVILPDGTHVWLNADSKISFPVEFSGGIRKIMLSGEAYFEVEKDRKHPFVVQTDKQEVTVLGTHFNINAYKDESSTKTTLLEGSVRVVALAAPGRELALRQRDVNEVILKPQQQSIIDVNKMEVIQANIEEVISWKKNYFRFNDEKLYSVMRKLARWYNVEVGYEDNVTNDGFTGTIARDKNISQVLSMLEKTKGIHFKIEGKKITVMK